MTLRSLALAAAALATAACATPPPPIPAVILPGLERRVEPAKNPAAPAAPAPAPLALEVSTAAVRLPTWSTAPPPEPPGPAPRPPAPIVPTPGGRFAYLSDRLYFELPRGWKAPVTAPGGATIVDGAGRSAATAAYHPEGSPAYDDPEAYRARLRSQGSIEDSAHLETVTLSGRFGTRRRWTTHRYKGSWHKLGEKEEVLYTEAILIPDPKGIYIFSFKALKTEFSARRAGFAELLRSVRLPRPDGPMPLPDPKSRRLAVAAWDEPPSRP
ncbi:MAG: hypothetical protein HYZ75_11620 [Elusimicrobia bacterium]|nr:hypothetical protein [Elusimicrobiota bacterium]